MTVRQAMQELVQQGLAIRKRGKGTIISPPKIVQPLFAVTSFTDSMSEAGVTVRNKLLHFELIAPDPLLRKNLQIGEGDLAIEILRMREASGLPVSLQRSFLSFDLAKNLVEIQDKLSTESLYKLLATYCNVTPAATSETLEIRSAKSSHAKLLNIATGDPLFYVEAITRSKDGVPIEYVEAYYRGDRFKFTLFNKL
jgi:GntR family transcriptional regulator